jgi:TonB family protein
MWRSRSILLFPFPPAEDSTVVSVSVPSLARRRINAFAIAALVELVAGWATVTLAKSEPRPSRIVPTVVATRELKPVMFVQRRRTRVRLAAAKAIAVDTRPGDAPAPPIEKLFEQPSAPESRAPDLVKADLAPEPARSFDLPVLEKPHFPMASGNDGHDFELQVQAQRRDVPAAAGGAGHGGGGTAAGASLEPPQLLLPLPRPRYTAAAREAKIEGEVVLECVFLAVGHVTCGRFVKTLGSGLDDAGRVAAQAISFVPAKLGNVAQDFPARVTITFSLASGLN